MQFPATFLAALVVGALVLTIAGTLLLAGLFLVDRKGGRLW